MEATEPRGINRRLQIEITDSLRLRFESRLNKTGDCWLWTAAQRNGYGALKHQGKALSAHVVAWVLANNMQVPAGKIITHTCDNRLCCRVHSKHVCLGTPMSNVREMYARIPMHKARGEMAHNAVLTEEMVRFVLAANALNGAGARTLAKVLGINERSIGSVLEGKSWAHVSKPSLQESEAIVNEFIKKHGLT